MKKIIFIGLMMLSFSALATPTLAITAPTDTLDVLGTTTLTFTFSEPVAGFDITKINVQGNGTVSTFSGSGAVYTATFTKTLEKTSVSVIVDNNSYTSLADGSTGLYAAIGFNAYQIYYVARGGIFLGLKDKAVPQPRCLLVGEELVNSADNSPATVLVQKFFVKSKNSFKQINQGCLIQVQTGQKIRRKLTPSAYELIVPQGAHAHSALSPKATWQDIGKVEGTDRPRLAPDNNASCTPDGTGQFSCGNVSGQFRITIAPVRIDSDDPIVFPGVKGKAHLHIFFANTSTNYQSNNASLLNAKTTANGGNANKTAYWMPAMIDTAIGTAMFPASGIFYYKTSEGGQAGGAVVEPLPQGLKGIAGAPSANSQATRTDNTSFSCLLRPDVTATGLNPGQKNADTGKLGSIPECSGKYYNILKADVIFTTCLADDGTGKIKLDSPDHRSHWQPGSGDVSTPTSNGCTVAFPHRITAIEQVVSYTIDQNQNTKTWRLSSDNYSSSIEGGYSLHADYWAMWKNYWMNRMTNQCNRIPGNCGTSYIGLTDGIGIASITTSGTTATVTTTVPHYLDIVPNVFYNANFLRVRISNVGGTDAASYNFIPSKVTVGGTVNPTAFWPVGSQAITVLNATQFTYVLNSLPSAGGSSKTSADLSTALVQWGESLCNIEDSKFGCNETYSNNYYGTKQ